MKITKKSLTVICPIYNEEEVISLFYESLSKVLKSCSYDSKIMFVVDRSSDNSLSVLTNIANNDLDVQIIALSSRFGHQMSLVAGMDHSESDIIIMMDSDLQHPPELIPRLLENYEEGFEVVYTLRNDQKQSNLLKRLTSRWFYSFLSIVSDLELSSGEADFRLISRKVANVFKNQVRERNQFLRGLFKWVGFNSVAVEYAPNPRFLGESKYNWTRMISFASSGIISFSKKPLQYAGLIGFVFFLVSIILICYSLFSFLTQDSMPSGFTTIAILVSLFGGIQLLFIGILGEYIGAIFDEVKARPLYLVDFVKNID
jgi:polyisoprenyl-phosphate glycosyltransferase